jgi:hypothetical protein
MSRVVSNSFIEFCEIRNCTKLILEFKSHYFNAVTKFLVAKVASHYFNAVTKFLVAKVAFSIISYFAAFINEIRNYSRIFRKTKNDKFRKKLFALVKIANFVGEICDQNAY